MIGQTITQSNRSGEDPGIGEANIEALNLAGVGNGREQLYDG